MKQWFKKYYKTLIVSAFLIPIITVAVVSISHVTVWYGITNPISWAMYLSVGVEIAALSSLASISGKVGKNVYFSFGIVTLIQFLGNVFYSYSFIDVNDISFKNWVDLVSPITGLLGVETTNVIGNKRFLALLTGGFLPLISLSFLHMLVKYNEQNDRFIEEDNIEKEDELVGNSDDVRLKLSDEELIKLENMMARFEPKQSPSVIDTPVVIKNKPKKRKYNRKPKEEPLIETPINDEITPIIKNNDEVMNVEITPIDEPPTSKVKKNKRREDTGFKIQRL